MTVTDFELEPEELEALDAYSRTVAGVAERLAGHQPHGTVLQEGSRLSDVEVECFGALIVHHLDELI